jgi:hypothetical protein
MARVLAAALFLLVPSAAAGGSGDPGAAKMTLAKQAPLTIRGTGFARGEQVRLNVHATRRATKVVSASAAGAFAARFPGLTYDRCLGMSATAVGNRGSHAKLKTPDFLCPPTL